MINYGYAADREVFENPLKFAIAQIVQEVPPFVFSGARSFADLPGDTQKRIEDWCSNRAVDTKWGYWFTGSSVVEAAELLVRMGLESGNIKEKE